MGNLELQRPSHSLYDCFSNMTQRYRVLQDEDMTFISGVKVSSTKVISTELSSEELDLELDFIFHCQWGSRDSL